MSSKQNAHIYGSAFEPLFKLDYLELEFFSLEGGSVLQLFCKEFETVMRFFDASAWKVEGYLNYTVHVYSASFIINHLCVPLVIMWYNIIIPHFIS